MASLSITDSSSEDNFDIFKEKVRDAICLLSQIPEEQRQEAWKYWQLVSVAVKVALGGRGSAVPTNRERLEARRGHTVRRRLVAGSFNSVLSAALMDVHYHNEDDADGEDGNQPENKTVAERKDDDIGLQENCDNISSDRASTVKSETVFAVTDGVKCATADCQISVSESDICKDFSSQFDSESNYQASDVHDIISNLSDGMQHDIVVKLSREPSFDGAELEVNIVTVPFSAAPDAVSQTNVITNTSKPEFTLLSGTSSNVVHVSPAPVALKRKRGRPRKLPSAASLNAPTSQQNLQVVQQKQQKHKTVPVSSAGEEISAGQEISTNATHQVNRQGEDHTGYLVRSATCNGSREVTSVVEDRQLNQEDVGNIFSAASTGAGKNACVIGFTPAVEQEGQQNGSVSTSADVNIEMASSQSLGVRRSERRSAPNRDELFCYFDKVSLVERTITLKDDGTQVTDSRLLDVNDQETRNGKLKTKDDKVRERTCPVCKTILCSSSSMAAHLRTHTGDRPFMCRTCGRGFTTKANCERHEATHIGLKAFTCAQCHKSFTEKKSMKIHMRSHTGERPYQCKVCGMRFFQTGTLKSHMDRHTGRKGHLCDFCGKAFRQRSQLRVHVLRHNKNMPYSCSQCKKTFYTKSDRERHMSKHTGERPFACNLCLKTFTRLQYLREHENVHLGFHPYRCSECGLSFPDRGHYNRHVQKHSSKPKQETEQQQGAIEITSLPEGKVIIAPQDLNLDSAEVQTYIVASSSYPTTQELISTATSATTTTVTTANSTEEAILNSLGLRVGEGAEVYHVTLVESSSGLHVAESSNTTQTVAGVDFSAINLLASATTQLSLPH